jgi:tetratricopeptide (TPR) repeat protein
MSSSDSNPSSQSDNSAIEAAASVVARARQGLEEGANGAARDLVKALEGLGDAQRDEDATSEAEAAYREAMGLLEKGEVDLPQRARLGSRLATLLDSSEREADSVPVYEQAIADYEAMTPPDEDVAAQLRNNLAMTYKGLGKHSLAEQHYLRALEILEQKHGLESEFTATLFNNLGSLYYTAGYSEQGKEMLVEALEIRTRLLGPDHPDVAQSFCNLASTCHELGEGLAAQEHYERGLSILEKHIKEEAASYEAVGLDYIALLEDQKETAKAAAFQKRMAKVLSSV